MNWVKVPLKVVIILWFFGGGVATVMLLSAGAYLATEGNSRGMLFIGLGVVGGLLVLVAAFLSRFLKSKRLLD